jgi:hypothetical protein
MGKGSKGIEVFVRVRPTKKPFAGLKLNTDGGENSLEFNF